MRQSSIAGEFTTPFREAACKIILKEIIRVAWHLPFINENVSLTFLGQLLYPPKTLTLIRIYNDADFYHTQKKCVSVCEIPLFLWKLVGSIGGFNGTKVYFLWPKKITIMKIKQLQNSIVSLMMPSLRRMIPFQTSLENKFADQRP